MTKRENDEAAMGCVAVLVLLISTPFSYMWRGWVLCQLWGWFVVPFFQLPALSTGYAIGLALIVGFLTERSSGATKKDESKSVLTLLIEVLCTVFIGPLFVLGIGWCVQAFALPR